MSWKRWLVAIGHGIPLVFLGSVPPASGQTRLDYAEHLLKQGDYFRSISVLKEQAFFTRDPREKQYLHLRLGEAYRKSGRPTAAMYYYTQVLGDSNGGESMRAKASIGLSMAYIQANSLPMARMALDEFKTQEQGRSQALVTALIVASEGDYLSAAGLLFSLVPEPGDPFDVSPYARQFEAGERSHRSPTIAGCLSFVLPGAGQAYSGHYFDAILSFGLVTSFALASYAAYRYGEGDDGSFGPFVAAAVVTSMFHAANVLGAVRTAKYFNFRVKEGLISDFRIKVLSLGF